MPTCEYIFNTGAKKDQQCNRPLRKDCTYCFQHKSQLNKKEDKPVMEDGQFIQLNLSKKPTQKKKQLSESSISSLEIIESDSSTSSGEYVDFSTYPITYSNSRC